MGIREFINQRPALGWGVAAAVIVVASVMFLRSLRGGETAELTQEVTIRCRDTGKEWTMPRGAMERALYMRSYPVNPDEGLPNPDTGALTGFPVDDWKSTITRINADRKDRAEGGAAVHKPAR
jgi:hypothetical protein